MKRRPGTPQHPPIRSLKLAEWPEADRFAWLEATKAGTRLRRGGTASHLKAVTQRDLVNRYGLFLDHLRRQQGVLPTSCNTAVFPEHVATFVAELRQRVSSVTLSGSIAKLLRAAEILCPTSNWTWLRELANDLALEMRPASKFNRVVDSHELVWAGTREMERGPRLHPKDPIRQAEIHRNGLMVALLAVCPIRSRNFFALEIDRHLIKVGESWHMTLRADETKERRIDERPLPAFINPWLETYLQTHRPVFGYDGARLWAGRSGTALSPVTMARNITQTTQRHLRRKISPHLFRTCAASTVYFHAGAAPNLATALLNHRSSEVTENHYNRSQGIRSAIKFAALVDALKQ